MTDRNYFHKSQTCYGQIYVITNILNSKIYIGKVQHPNTILKRWERHLRKARRISNLKQRNPNKKIRATHFVNALCKYPKEVWRISEKDVAFNKTDLNLKEKLWIQRYDAMNRDKGYNMTAGGEGGVMRAEIKIRISETMIRKYKTDPEFMEKVTKGWAYVSRRAWKNPEYIEKQRKANISRSLKMKKKWKHDPEYRKKVTEGISIALIDKWRSDPDYRTRVSETTSKSIIDLWKIESYRRKQLLARSKISKKIEDIPQFLTDIKNELPLKILTVKYDMSNKTIYRKLQNIFKNKEIKNLKCARSFLFNHTIQEVIDKMNSNE